MKSEEINYSDNYLKVSTNTYKPYSGNLKRLTGVYVMTDEYEREVMKNTGDTGLILYNFFMKRGTYKYFRPTDNKKIGEDIGWSASKVNKVKTKLAKAQYLLILKDTLADGAINFRVLLGKELIVHYKKYNKIPSDSEMKLVKKSDSEDNDIPVVQEDELLTTYLKEESKLCSCPDDEGHALELNYCQKCDKHIQ